MSFPLEQEASIIAELRNLQIVLSPKQGIKAKVNCPYLCLLQRTEIGLALSQIKTGGNKPAEEFLGSFAGVLAMDRHGHDKNSARGFGHLPPSEVFLLPDVKGKIEAALYPHRKNGELPDMVLGAAVQLLSNLNFTIVDGEGNEWLGGEAGGEVVEGTCREVGSAAIEAPKTNAENRELVAEGGGLRIFRFKD